MSFLQWSVLSVVFAIMLSVGPVFAGDGQSMLEKASEADQAMFAEIKVLLLKDPNPTTVI